MISSVQFINKVLLSKNINMIIDNAITSEYMIGYETEFNSIISHYKQYKVVMDKETFIDKFPNWKFIDVREPDVALIDRLREEHLYTETVQVIQQSANLLTTNANEAVSYLLQTAKTLTPAYSITGIDIAHHNQSRLDSWKAKHNGEIWSVASGFPELDKLTYGWLKGEELIVLLARSGVGKSQILVKTAVTAWQNGETVGFISPEMSANSIGYRFDTVVGSFSNTALITGTEVEGYEDYLKNVTKISEKEFNVAIPNDFGDTITVSKLRQYIITHHLTFLCIDGISYLEDERYARGDNKSTTLANISRDLFNLSLEFKIPILTVVQSNRNGTKQKDGVVGEVTLENIRDSDGIAYSATRVISIRQCGPALELGLQKNRYGKSGSKVLYTWDIDHAIFTWIPTIEEIPDQEVKEIQKENFGSVF